MPVKVIAVKCPSCGQPIQQKSGDLVFLCGCGKMHTRDDKGTHDVKYEIAALPREGGWPAPPVYYPVWKLDSEVAIHYTRSEGGGGFFTKLFGKDWKGGRVFIWVPAIEGDPGSFKHWAQWLTSNSPKYSLAPSFGSLSRMSLNRGPEEAAALADFLILTFEAEKPGVLQDINYEVHVNDTILAYLPFVTGPKGIELAL
jgi:hypothetical protein